MSRQNDNTSRARSTAFPVESLPEPWQQHLAALRTATVEDYLDWCRVQGFACSHHKTALQMHAEQRHAARLLAAGSDRPTRRGGRSVRLLRRVLADQVDPAWLPWDMRMAHTQLFCPHHAPELREFTRRLLSHTARCCSDLPHERLSPTRDGAIGTFLPKLLRIAEYHRHAVRPVEAWRPRTHNPRRRLAALLRHLFATWEVPHFLDKAWLEDSAAAVEHRHWFMHLGQGASLRSAGLPIDYTKKMAHHFVQAPADYTVAEALRWGQVLGLGGDPRLVEALRGTRLCRTLDADTDEFWSSVLRFLIRHSELVPAQVAPIVDYLYHERFAGDEYVTDDGSIQSLPPAQPGLTMRGRTPKSLLKQVTAWHQRLGIEAADSADTTWRRSGIPPFRSKGTGKSDSRAFTIRELTSSSQLRTEGRRMRHCVAVYTRQCHRGYASIWTMECTEGTRVARLLTIEVANHGRRIVQARGPNNDDPTDKAREIMNRWANAVGLGVASWV